MTLLNIKDIKVTFSQNVLYSMKDDFIFTLAGFSQRESQFNASLLNKVIKIIFWPQPFEWQPIT